MFRFIKKVFSSCLGVLLGFSFSLILLILLLVGATTYLLELEDTPKMTTLSANSVLHIKLDGWVVERAEESPLAYLREDKRQIGLEDLRIAIQASILQPEITSIYLEVGNLVISPASADEIRTELSRFRGSGKKIIAYASNYTQSGYYIASIADEVYINPQGMLDLKGLAAERTFYKKTFEKLGVNMQVFRVGTYKSAVEPYIETSMSEANRVQTREYLQIIWNYQLEQIGKNRSLSVDSLNQLVDKGLLFQDPQKYQEWHLVDSLLYESEVIALLKSKRGLSDSQKLNLIKPEELASWMKPVSSPNEIAILFAEGEIVSESVGGEIMDNLEIVEKRICKEIDKLRKNDKVKAVVLRVNSPGGSAYASEQIWKELRKLNEQKPLVVSMGDYAASGGYYIASAASHIVASPLSITGSIGIFGMAPDVSGLTDKIGLSFDGVKTNRYADMPSLFRPMREDEKTLMQGYVERGYKTFLNRCLEGRKQMTYASLDSIAQGRVWTGISAYSLGLVDELGDLNQAIRKAASLAQTTDYMIQGYPAKKDWVERVLKDAVDSPTFLKIKEQYKLMHSSQYRTTLWPATNYLQAILPERIIAY